MIPSYEELDVRQTWLGELVLRRRTPTVLNGGTVYEIGLDGMFLMSSVVNATETALATLGLAAHGGEDLDVVVGGLGLGQTAVTALADPRVRSLRVVECLRPVIDWHEESLVPLGETLVADPRCEFVHADFFALAEAGSRGFDEAKPGRLFHAILVDIDHSPRALLHGSHQDFYEAPGLRGVASHLLPGGVFALWSADPVEPEFVATLGQVFAHHEVHEIPFENIILGETEINTVYVATTAGTDAGR